MDTPTLTIEAVNAETDIEVVRKWATDLEISFSGNSGIGTIQKKIVGHLEAFNDDDENAPDPDDNTASAVDTEMDKLLGVSAADKEEPIQVAKPAPKGASIAELLKMDPTKIEDPVLRRQAIRAQALKLVRISLANIDPADAQLPGAVISVTSKYTGKVSKYVPFGDENEAGWHVPQIILDYLQTQKFVLRKEIRGGQFGIKRYKTSYAKKYSIDILPPLTKDELASLAAKQQASHAIDKP